MNITNDVSLEIYFQNIDVLENLIRDDIAAAKTPVMLVCFAGK